MAVDVDRLSRNASRLSHRLQAEAFLGDFSPSGIVQRNVAKICACFGFFQPIFFSSRMAESVVCVTWGA
jgi:hypothetical protein